MEEKIEDNRRWQLLDGDKDVLLINGEAFIVSGFKELVEDDLIKKFDYVKHQKTIRIGKTVIGLDEIKWNSHPEGIIVELLRIGAKEWQKGKVRIKSYIEIGNNVVKVQVDIEFSPDEPPLPESPLDDLRQLPEYKQQL